MAEEIIDKLQELVINLCDKLYAKRQLITTSTVKKMLLVHHNWDAVDLDMQLPTYINNWRLQNLQGGHDFGALKTKIKLLEEQVSQYKADLQLAQQIISSIVKELRGLSHV